LRDSEERYRALFEQAAESILLIDPATGALVEFNEMAHRDLGYTREEFAKLRIPDFEEKESAEEVRRHAARVMQAGRDLFETRQRTKSGEVRDVEVRCRVVSVGGRRLLQSVYHDITERKRMERAMQTMSLTDELTGLYNRRGFMTLAEQQLKVAKRERVSVVLLFIDVDGMKAANDHLGHQEGDALLIAAARVLRKSFREADLVGRLGGDEFAVLSYARHGRKLSSDTLLNRL
jgi:PAS domain S-box-containing protein